MHCCHQERFRTIIYNQFQNFHHTAVRVECVIDHILMEFLVCLDGVLYAENVYGKTYRVEHAEHHSNYHAYRVNEKDLLQILRLKRVHQLPGLFLGDLSLRSALYSWSYPLQLIGCLVTQHY